MMSLPSWFAAAGCYLWYIPMDGSLTTGPLYCSGGGSKTIEKSSGLLGFINVSDAISMLVLVGIGQVDTRGNRTSARFFTTQTRQILPAFLPLAEAAHAGWQSMLLYPWPRR